MGTLTRHEATMIAIGSAVRHGSNNPNAPSYLPKTVNENWQPHEWVVDAVVAAAGHSTAPIPMRLTCPACGELHIDEGEFATRDHHTHACQHCGNVWRPAVVNTVGVRFLPGFKNP